MRDARAAVLLDAGADPQLIDCRSAYGERSTDLNMRGDRGDEASVFSRDGSPIAGGFFG